MILRALRRRRRATSTSAGGGDRDRGATGVEYALAVSVFVLASVGGIDLLEDNTEAEYQNSASGIEGLPGNGGFGGGGTPTTTTPTLPPTTTTVIDSGPTTTTTAPQTTTTTTGGGGGTTTTTVAVHTTITAATDVSQATNGGKWNARAEFQLRNSQTNDPIEGAVVHVDMETANGATKTTSCTTGPAGTCVVSWNNLRNKHDPALATAVDVTSSPSWDGLVTSVNLAKP